MLKETNAEEFKSPSAGAHESESNRVLVCARCKRLIARRRDQVAVNGSHVHTFVNPDNETFMIGCFGDAPGLIRVSPATLSDTWFAGYSWQGESCGGCRMFLGWLYRQGDHRFHGLILAGLNEIDEQP